MAPHPDEILLIGKAGSIAVMNSHLWHGGTANRTAAPRLAMHAFYCRRDKPQQQYQKQLLDADVQAGLSPELRDLLAIDDPLNDALSADGHGPQLHEVAPRIIRSVALSPAGPTTRRRARPSSSCCAAPRSCCRWRWPLLRGRVFVYNDLSWFHLPLRHLYQQALEKGDSLLWTPAIFTGLYFHGEGQTGVFHPLHLLLYRLLPLRTAFNLELLANYVAAFAGMWWFLRRLRFATVPALFGAMLFAFSGFMLLHHHHLNMVAVVAHLPWLLAAADVLLVEDDAPRAAPRVRRGRADPGLRSS